MSWLISFARAYSSCEEREHRISNWKILAHSGIRTFCLRGKPVKHCATWSDICRALKSWPYFIWVCYLNLPVPRGTDVAKLLYPPQTKFGGYIGITLSVCVCLFVRLSVQSKLNIGYNFWTKRDKAFILHMCIPCDKTFLSVPKILTSWPWPWLLTYFWKNLTLDITF